MLDLLGWDVGMSLLAAIVMVVGALVIGVVAQLIGEVTLGFQWAVTGLGALIGGYIGSESFGTYSTWGAEFDGLYIVPALIGAVVLGGIVDVVVRYLTSGHYTSAPRPI
jgi:uncharacterized membrane protein YeaQ/YmgE (transglycosylase-associated protein family)